MTYIYYTYIDSERHHQILSNFSQDFSKVYNDKIIKFWKWQDAQLSMLGTYLLRYGLKEIGLNFNQIKISTKKNSKPYLEAENIDFNISHSENIVVCAISDCCEIGIDIEIIRQITISDFKSQMTGTEWRKIFNSDHRESSFFDYWTQKEAVLKSDGCGIIDSLLSFEVTNNHTFFRNSSFFIKELYIDPTAKCHLAFKDKLDLKNLKLQFIDSSKL